MAITKRVAKLETFYGARVIPLRNMVMILDVLLECIRRHCDPETVALISAELDAILDAVFRSDWDAIKKWNEPRH
jgi:hypothetical protein